MHRFISNIAYGLIALLALGFAVYTPSLTHVALAGATPQLYAKNAEISGFVVGIMDGDTLKLLTDDRRELRIRLAEIDAPEKNQAYGDVSKRSLSDLAYGKPASVHVVDTDRYGRIVGRVYIGTLDVNLAQVGRGMAWAYTEYLTDPQIAKLEARARQARVGLWADSREPVPPWEFRHANGE